MTNTITLKDVAIHSVIEQQGSWFEALEFFPTLSKEVLEENLSWLKPTFVDPANGRLVLCVQSFVITPNQGYAVSTAVGGT